MEQNKMTPAPWKVEIIGGKFPAYSITTDIEEGTNNTICNLFTATMGEKEHQEFNAAAIVSAINATYGNSINPEAVKDMLAALRVAKAAILHSGATGGQTNYDALEAATAAIEKAKL